MTDTAAFIIVAAAIVGSVTTAVIMRGRQASYRTWAHSDSPGSRNMAMRLANRIGHRGAFLLFLAILDAAYSYALTVEATPTSRFHLTPSADAWAGLWAAAGLICLSGVLMRRDWPQYTCAALIKTTWAAQSAQLWLVQHEPLAWVSVLVWAAFAATVVLVASWPEPPKPLPPPDSAS